MKLGSLVTASVLLVACGAHPAVTTNGGGSTGGAPGASTTPPSNGGTSTPMPPPFTFTTPPAGTMPPVGGGTPPGGMKCGEMAFDLKRAPADLLVVLDRSGSMGDMVAGVVGTKWTNVTSAIDDTLMATDGTLGWGLKVFPSPGGCAVADGAEVPLAPHNFMPISTAITPIIPAGNTPTAAAITKSVDYLKTLTTPTVKYMVLATDGEPNCGAAGGGIFGRSPGDGPGAVAAVQAAAAAGFHTFVVGIATGPVEEMTLNAMAMAGMEPRTGASQYYPVASRADLVATLGLITGVVTNCVFPLDKAPPAPNDVTVKVDGNVVTRDPMHANGWDLAAGARSIQVFGAACDALKANAMAKVEVVYGCYIP
jgi:hypothetical protein